MVDTYTLLELQTQERWDETDELLGSDFLENRYLEDHLRFENWLLGARQRWWGYADALHYARCWRALKDVQSGLRIASEMGHREWEVGDYRFRFRYPTFPSLGS